jgi:adenylate cyclase
MKEIERKFLVNKEQFPGSDNKIILKQGYLSVDPERVVRIRREGDQARITIKGKIEGITRPEFEYPIPVGDSEAMLKLALFPPVEKIRHRLVTEGTHWEVDEFLGANAGLLMAEVELTDENQPFSHPAWLGEEVTHDRRYYNSQLSQHPYTLWKA